MLNDIVDDYLEKQGELLALIALLLEFVEEAGEGL